MPELELALLRLLLASRAGNLLLYCVPSNKVRVVIVLTKNVVLKDNQSRLVGCQMSRKLVAIG